MAAEIRRQAIESARSDPSPPARARPDIDPQRRLAATPTKSHVVPAIFGAAACVLVGLGAVAFIREVSTARPPPAKASTARAATPSEPKRPASATPPPPPVPSAAPSASAGPHNLPQFRTRPARTALDRAAKGLAACNTGPKSLWGTGGAIVHFDNDGKVSEISLGPPFRTAPEGTCVLAALRDADMGPFVGPSFAISYEFMVPRPTSTSRPK